MTESSRQDVALHLVDAMGVALGLRPRVSDRIRLIDGERLESCLAVSDLAVASIGAAACALGELMSLEGVAPGVSVDYRLASLWFGWSIQPIG